MVVVVGGGGGERGVKGGPCMHSSAAASVDTLLLPSPQSWLENGGGGCSILTQRRQRQVGPPIGSVQEQRFVHCVAFRAHLRAAHTGQTSPQRPTTEPLLVKPMPSLGHKTLTKLESATTKKLDPQCAVARPCSG